MKTSRTLAALVATTAIALTASRSQAVDGVVEINAAKAEAGGVNFFDAPGFPVSINEPGSYRLTSNLIVSEIGVGAIVIGSTDVTLDLNGFSIIGSGGQLGTATGIESTQANVRIQNGTVTQFTGHGIHIQGDFAVVDNVRALANTGLGIRVDDHAIVSNCTATGNGDTGIFALTASTLRDNVAAGNGDRGIHCANRCTIAGNTVTQSNGNGIESNNGSTIANNNVSLSGANGIYVTDAAAVTGNSSRENVEDGIRVRDGCTVSNNTSSFNGSHGICAFSGNTLIGNTVASNQGRGIDTLATTGYGMNVMHDNDLGTVSAAAAEIGVNLCNGLNACP